MVYENVLHSMPKNSYCTCINDNAHNFIIYKLVTKIGQLYNLHLNIEKFAVPISSRKKREYIFSYNRIDFCHEPFLDMLTLYKCHRLATYLIPNEILIKQLNCMSKKLLLVTALLIPKILSRLRHYIFTRHVSFKH